MIEAAGGVVWRACSRDRIKLLLIHRPRYDDWSLPKGKVEGGETPLDAALREIYEETGLCCEPGAPLPEVRYVDHKGRPKRVRYWAMRLIGGDFAPNREVDQIRWLPAREAVTRLSYGHDIPVVVAFTDLLLTA